MIDEQFERAVCEKMVAEFFVSGDYQFDSVEEMTEAVESAVDWLMEKRAEARAQGSKMAKQAVIAELDAMRERVSREEFGT